MLPKQAIRDYYGKVLKSRHDLRTNACCTVDSPPEHIQTILNQIHPKISERFYGCGAPFPSAIEGRVILDLGCGSGRDCYVLSELVGPHGSVIGVDMTDEQIELAREHQGYHADIFGFERSNVEFHHGHMEALDEIGIEDSCVDVVVSNCVLNLSPDKERAFSEIFRVLKPGGELYFSDVFATRRPPPELAEDPVLLGECLGNVLYTEDFRRLLARVGRHDARVVASNPITLEDPEIERKAGMIEFLSMTTRTFMLDLEDRCEDYGQVASYRGTIDEHPHRFVLDDHHVFETGRPLRVCGNTADMLGKTRFAPHFEMHGDRSVHYGLFDCAIPATGANGIGVTKSGCC